MLQRLIKILYSKRYVLYQQPYQLNIVGIRSVNNVSNSFDDALFVFFKDSSGKWNYACYPITTDPGTYWLKNPSQVDGTAILAQGQYLNAYSLGLHKGKYLALVESKAVKVIRDYDRNAYLDFLNGKVEQGNFGINIHRANPSGETNAVDKWSAGCQVFKNAADFAQFISLCQKHRSLYGNVFTYTLIDFRSFRRQALRWVFSAATLTLTLLGGALWLSKQQKKNNLKNIQNGNALAYV